MARGLQGYLAQERADPRLSLRVRRRLDQTDFEFVDSARVAIQGDCSLLLVQQLVPKMYVFEAQRRATGDPRDWAWHPTCSRLQQSCRGTSQLTAQS